MTSRPTARPIVSPTTSVPSQAPSMTGLVASFEVGAIVSRSLSDEEIVAIESEVTTTLNVTDDDVATTGKSYVANDMCVF